MILNLRTAVPESSAPNTTESTATCRHVGVEHAGRSIADAKIHRSNNAGRDTRLAIAPRGTHGGNAVHKLGLTDTPVRFGPICLEHCSAFNEHGRDYIVPARQIRKHLIQQVAFPHGAATGIPEVVVRITNGKLRLEDRLQDLFEPVLVREFTVMEGLTRCLSFDWLMLSDWIPQSKLPSRGDNFNRT